MMSFFIHVIYLPIYNLLAFLVDVMPNGDLGLAVVATALAVRVIFLPLSLSAARTQHAMKEIQPMLEEIKKKYKEDPQEQARHTFALYKEHGVRPFSSILMVFLQLPIIIGLYAVARDAAHYSIDPGLLYSFVAAPHTLSELFLGIFSVAGPSLPLAIFAGLMQLAYSLQSVPIPPKATGDAKGSMQGDFNRSLAIQLRYFYPFVIAFIAYASGVVALYFATTNLFMLIQGFFVKRMQADAATKSAGLSVEPPHIDVENNPSKP